MLKNKKFAKYAIAFCILGILFNFMYSGLQNDQINIIQAYSAWNNTLTQMPITVGNFVCIVLTFVYGTLFIKFGVRKTLIPCIAVCAAGCLGIAAAGGLSATTGVELASAAAGDVGIYWLYAVSLFLIRCGCMCFQMAGFQLAASWFIRYRGRVLGLVTLGSPLFSVVGTSVFNKLIASHMGSDYRPFYVGLAVILVLIAVCVVFFLRDYPEDVGLYPDGADHAPKSEQNSDGAEVNLTVKQVLSQKKSWILIISFACFLWVINACMASMASWFVKLFLDNTEMVMSGAVGAQAETLGAPVLFLAQATTWLSVGALLGIPLSFLFGVIDDKLGTPIACIILGITCVIPPIGLLSQASAVASTGSCNIPMLVLWGIGVACITGGVPTMNPASVSFMFGRREYQSANRVIMSIQLVPSAVAATVMMALINSGHGAAAWISVIVVALIGTVTCIPMLKMKDANAEDRG